MVNYLQERRQASVSTSLKGCALLDPQEIAGPFYELGNRCGSIPKAEHPKQRTLAIP